MKLRTVLFVLACAGAAVGALANRGIAAPQHGIAMYGAPALPPDFVALPYANPKAPKGGTFIEGNTQSFDSVNPFVRKGTAPWQLRFYGYESLMGRNWDEPFSLYGLLAESIETAEDRSWVSFTLRPEARFSDGSPVTVEDVIWSYETLGTKGHPRYLGLARQITDIKQTGPRTVRFTFAEENRELALITGLRPILKKAQYAGRDFAEATLEDAPIGTGPYVISRFEPGRSVVLHRNPDYWGADLPLNAGLHNFDEIRIEVFADANVMFEAFKAGALNVLREFNAERWATDYDFPAVTRGDVVLSEVPHQKPAGLTGFVFNMRRAPYDDLAVRTALLTAFNFDYINDTLTGGRQVRITSPFANSPLAMVPGPAPDAVRALLAPFAGTIPADTLAALALPESDGTARNRAALRKAAALLENSGWTVENGRRTKDGRPLEMRILLRQSQREALAMAEIYARALDRLGISATIERVDDAAYEQRLLDFDFDLTWHRILPSLSPGNEQRLYWGSASANEPGTRNLMGLRSPAVDAMIDAMLKARSEIAFRTAVKALDRLLVAERAWIPVHGFETGRIAHSARLHFPDRLPIYGDGAYWAPPVWWWE